MLTSKPRLTFSVEGEVIKTTNTPHPDTQSDVVAMCDYKLNEEFQYEPRGLLLKVHVHKCVEIKVVFVLDIIFHFNDHSKSYFDCLPKYSPPTKKKKTKTCEFHATEK